MEKSNKSNSHSVNKSKYFVPIISMIIYICIALFITLGVRAAFGNQKEDESIKISNNSGEEFYFNDKYDSAITEFTSLQEKDNWPSYTADIGKIQSIQGNYVKSNSTLQKAYEGRNKVIDTKSAENDNIKEKDIDLASQIVFTYFLNGEYKKALDYGEFYLNIYPQESKLQQTMFTVYLSNNESEKAKDIVKNYNLDEQNSDDIVSLAQMNFILGNYDTGLKFLNEAWNVDKNSLEIFDAVEQVSDRTTLLNNIIKAKEKKENEEFYNAVLAKIYSLNEADKEKALALIEKMDKENVDSANVDLLKYELLKDKDGEDIIDVLKDKYDGTTLMGCYIRAIENYENKKYDEAFKYAKKCIVIDKNYNGTYYFIEKIKSAQQKSQLAEPFIIEAMYNEKYNYNTIVKTAEYYKNILKDSNKAIHYYELAGRVNPKDADVFYNIGLIQLNNQRIDEAIASIKKSISINESSSKYYRTLGCIYLDKKDDEKAIEYIRKAYSFDDKDILTLNDAACYYAMRDNNIDRAMTNIKSAYDGINEKTKEENKKIISDNYNRIKIAFDSSQKDSNSKTKVSELKLIY
ncbi:MAG TPA: hypothetical protein DG753_08650 [Clostridium sp.]|nr:hypothetical protein [Clostridium sp.]